MLNTTTMTAGRTGRFHRAQELLRLAGLAAAPSTDRDQGELLDRLIEGPGGGVRATAVRAP